MYMRGCEVFWICGFVELWFPLHYFISVMRGWILVVHEYSDDEFWLYTTNRIQRIRFHACVKCIDTFMELQWQFNELKHTVCGRGRTLIFCILIAAGGLITCVMVCCCTVCVCGTLLSVKSLSSSSIDALELDTELELVPMLFAACPGCSGGR